MAPENAADTAPKDDVGERQVHDAVQTQNSKVRETDVAPAVSGDPAIQPQAQINESRLSESERASKPAGEITSDTADNGKIDVNTASVTKLTELPGLREESSGHCGLSQCAWTFAKVSDLTKVKGIGMKMLEKMAPYVQIR